MARYVITKENVEKCGGVYEYVHSEGSFKIGIDTRIFASNLKSVGNADNWSISIDLSSPETAEKIYMTSSNPATRKTVCWAVNAVDTDDQELFHRSVEDYNYACQIMYNAALFSDMVRDLGFTDDYIVRICCDGTRLVFISNGSINSVRFEIQDGEIDMEKRDQHQIKGYKRAEKRFIFNVIDKSPESWPFCDSYHWKILQRVTKAKSFSESVKIYLRRQLPDGMPIALCYEGTIGKLQFFIAPYDDNDQWGPYEKRKMPDPIGCFNEPDTDDDGEEEEEVEQQPGMPASAQTMCMDGRNVEEEEEENEGDVDDNVSNDSNACHEKEEEEKKRSRQMMTVSVTEEEEEREMKDCKRRRVDDPQ